MKKVIYGIVIFLVLVSASVFIYKEVSSTKVKTEQLLPDQYLAILKIENSSVANLSFSSKINEYLSPLLVTGFEDFPDFSKTISSHGTGKITEWSSNYWLGFYPKDSASMSVFGIYEISQKHLSTSRDFINDLVVKSKFLVNTYSVQGTDVWEIKENNISYFLTQVDDKIMYSNDKDLIASSLLNIELKEFNQFRKQKEIHANEVHLEPITLYVNVRQLQKTNLKLNFLKIDNKYFSTFVDFAVLEVKENNNNLFLHGFSYIGDTSVSFLSALESQKEVDFDHFNMIPKSSFFVSYLNISLLQEYVGKLQNFDHFHYTKEKELNTDRQQMINEIKSVFEETALYSVFENSIREYDRVLILKLKNETSSLFLEGFHEKFELNSKQKSVEEYKGKKIYKLSQNGVVNAFFGNSHSPFENCFYTVIDGYAVFSDQIQGLFSYINVLTLEKTWKFELQHDYFTNEQITSSTAGWVFDFENSKTQNHKINCAIVQFGTFSRNKIYTSIKLFPSNQKAKVLKAQEITEETSTEETKSESHNLYSDFDTDLTENIYLIDNYASKQKEVIVQDINHKIYCLTLAGKKDWEQRLDGPIVSPIFQIDVLKNNKEQYVFATEKKIYCIDRLGHMVSHFPKTFSFPISGFQLVDYDGSKNYRFLMTSNSNAYISDIKGNLLEGWKPNKLSEKPILPLTFVRSGKKDYFIEISKSGKIQFLNRMGKVVSSTKLNTNVFPQFVFDHEGEKTDVVVLSEKGTLSKISPKTTHKLTFSSGKETSEAKLLVDVVSDKFRLAVKNKLYDESFALLFSYEGEVFLYRNVKQKGYAVIKTKEDKIEVYTEKGVKVKHPSIEFTENVEVVSIGSKVILLARYKSEILKFELHVE